jgi:signal transduction histidine kinase/ligand-binding sensor domain-containing protein
MLRHAIGFFIAGFCLVATAADTLPFWRTSMHHTGWTQKDGAPTNVLFMTQAADGMMLFGAYDGLYRFDGVRFERVDSIDGNKLLSPNVTSLANFDGALWLTYQFGGVSVFKNGKARHYDTKDGLPPGVIRHVDLSPKGVMWASSPYGMYWLDGARWRHAGAGQGLPDGGTQAFNFLADGSVITYVGDGMYRSAPGEPKFRQVLTMPGIEGGDDRPDGSIWLYSQKSGITAYNPDTGALSKVTLPGGVYSYKSDKRGGFWLNTGASIQLLDRDMKPVRSYTRAQGFTADTFGNAFDDREGNLWFTTSLGVDRLRETKLTTVALPPMYDSPLVTPGADGQIWITGDYRSEGFGIARDGARTQTGIKNAMSTLSEPGGAIWFGTEQQLLRRDGKARQSWDFPAELKGRRVQAMARGADGVLWLSMLGKGAYTFRDGAWLQRGGVEELGKDTPIWLFADNKGAIWFGYTKSRIAVLDHGKLTRYASAEGLDIGNVLAIHSRAGRIWAGGESGLAYLEGGRFVSLLRRDGTGFKGVSGIVETAVGDLWLHHVDGITRIPASQIRLAVERHGRVDALEEFNHLDGLEGLPAQISPLPSLREAPDGRIWYATGASVGWIDPAHILKNTQAPDVLIESIATDDKTYPPTERTLPESTRALHIQFTATALSMPERAQFRYRLSGVDADWRNPGLAREAFYTNLSPGEYKFEVIAANEDGVWNDKGASIEFRIPPTFMQTVAFKVICGLLALAVLYLLYLWRVRALTARMQERMDERLDERERIARALHDTFLQSLQGLILRVDGIRARVPDDGESRQMVEKILDDADQLVAEGRSEVLGLRTGGGAADALQQVFAKVADSMKDQSPSVFALRASGTARLLRADIQDEVVYIGREAVLNAFRHARAGAIDMDIVYGDRAFSITVRDDGAGMPHEPAAPSAGHRHFGIAGMRERARRIGAELTIESGAGGTTVRIVVPARQAYHRPARTGWRRWLG